MKRLKLFFACLLMAVLSIGQVWADVESGTAYTTTSGSFPTGWSKHSGNEQNKYIGLYSGDYIQTENFCQNGFTSIVVSARKLNGPSDDEKVLTIEWIPEDGSDAVVLGTVSPGGTSLTNLTLSSFSNTPTANTSGSIKLSCKAAPSAKGDGVGAVTINYTAGTCGGGTQTCATPTFDPEDGETFDESIDVEIETTTDGATIYYTTDGNNPTTSSSVYSSALHFTETTTLKAMAVKEGSNNSAVASATYTKIVSVPGYEIDFESELVSYVDWNFSNFTKTNETITIHGGSYFAKTNGTNTASITTKTKVANPGILTYYISKIGTNTNANSKWKARVSSDGTNWTIVGTEYAAGAGVTAGTWNECTADLTDYTDVYVQVYYDGTTAVRTIDDVSLTTVTPGTVATPTISGETPFVTSTTITLACTTEGASVYYTTDGSNPSSGSTLYTEPFVLNAGATVKAIAIKGSSSSAIANKEFTKVVSYTTLADIYAKAVEVGETATDIYVTFNSWKISAKNSNNAFLTDGTNGAVIYGSGHGFNAGDVLTGTAACKVQLYKGFAELTTLGSGTAGLTVTPGTVGDPIVKTWSQLSPVNTGALVKIENLTYDGSSLSDGENTIPTYTTFYTASFESGKKYNLTGVYQYYNTNGQILPRSAADVEEVIETYTVTYNNAPDNGTLTIKNGDDVVTSGSSVNEGTVLDIIATPDEGYKLVGVTVNGSAYAEATLELTENVTIAATFEENLAPLVTSYDLSEIGVVTSHLNGERVGDKVNLPLTAASCSKTFVGWSANASCAVAPEYAPGAEYTLEANNILYAVYADPAASATWNVATSLEAGDVVVISTNTGYTTHEMKTAGAISSSLMGCMASTYNADNSQITALAEGTLEFTVGGNATDGWTLMNGTKYLKVTAAKKVNLVDDEETWTISFSGNNATLAPKTGDYTGYSLLYNYNSGTDRFTAYNSAMTPISLYKQVASYENYSTDCQAAVATPTFSPVAGTYTEVQNVTISTETADATIYYTTNGDVPTTSSTLYEGAIEVAESKTIKAIAVKDGMANSTVATAAYTINLPLSTMDQIFAAATAAGSTATDANIQFNNWVVSGVSTNGKNVFVTDGTKGFIIFDSGASMGFAVGDVLSGTAACKVQLYNGAAELTTLSSTTEGLNVATGGTVTPEVKAISALSGINTGAAVTINSVQFDGEYLSDGANEIKPYNSLFAYEALENGKYYNVTGIYQQFGNTTKEILPRSAADIEEVSLSDPEISYTPASATIELGQDLPGTVFANPHELAISYTSDNEAVATVSNTGVIALGTETGTAVITASFAGNATYAPANVTYTITVNPASVSENVVILAVYNEKYYAMSTTIPSEAFTAIEVEYDGSKVTVNSAEDKAAIQWTKKISGDNTTFQTKGETSMYMKGTSSGAAMSLNANVCNWSWDGTNEYYYIGSRTFLYQNGVGFKNYATSNIGKTGYSGKAQVIAIAPENIVITSKVSAELAYDPESVTLTVGQTFVPATLTYAEGFDGLAAVTYESSNLDLATVNAAGEVELEAGITGTATITATFAGNNNYLAGSASYLITVNEAGDDLSGTWTLASSVAAGDKIIIGATKDANTYAMGKQNSNNRAAVASTLEGETLTPGAATKVFTLVDAGEGKFAIQAANGKYLTSATSGSSNNLLEAENYDLDNAKWTITIDGEGVASVVAAAGSKTVMQYNSGNTLFSCYGSASQTDINIYKQGTPEPPVVDYTEVRNGLTEGWYYTMCLDKAVTAVKAGSIWRVLSKAANGKDVILEEVTGTLDAGRPYIFRAAASTLEVAYTGDAVDDPVNDEDNNGLIGSFSQTEIAQSPNNFIIYNNELYYVNSEKVYVGANRAYLDMTGVPAYSNEPQQGNAPRRRVVMTVHGEQTATGCENINASETPVKMIIDGQLYILRGEKMYDATGKLVK